MEHWRILYSRGKRQQLPQRDVGFPRITKREGFGQVFLGEYLRFQTFWNLILLLLEHDAHGYDSIGSGRGVVVRSAIVIPPAEIFRVAWVAMPHRQKTAVLGSPLRILKGLVEPFHIDAGQLLDLACVRQRS